MAEPEQGWYIAEPDGTTFGPFSRGEFSLQRARGGFSAEALAWHVDFSEWRPLARIAMSGPTRAGEASRGRAAAHVDNVAAQAQSRSAPSKAERKAARQASAQSGGGGAKAKSASTDDGRRLLQGAALARAAARPAASSTSHPAMTPAARPGGPALGNPAAVVAPESAARLALAARRLLARALDTLTLGMLGASLAWGFAWREVANFPVPNIALLLWASVFAMVPLAALSLALTGRTPAKALLGLETRTPAGGNPTFISALKREIDVLWRGMGLGIPVLGLITLVVAGTTLTNQGETTWDKRERLTTRSSGDAKWQPAVIALLVAFYLLGTDTWMQLVYRIVAAE